MFVLDFLPEKYLNGGAEKSVAIFTAGWAMKFVPTLGKALSEMVLKGDSKDYKLDKFSITRPAPAGKEIIQENCDPAQEVSDKVAAMSIRRSACEQAQGSSCGKRALVQEA
jgi:sarcosine oxidase/L-pipecolate oxidase